MKKIDFKSLIKIAVTVFGLYLAIHYWPHAANFIKTVISAAMPVLVGLVVAYPINILMTFYERHFFPNSKKSFLVKGRRGISLSLALLTLVAILTVVIALVVPQVVSCIKLLIAEIPGFVNIVVEKLNEFEFVPDDILATLSNIDWKSRLTDIIKTVSSGVGSVMDVVVSTVSSVVSGVTTTALAVIFAIYLLLGKEKLGSQIKRISEKYLPGKINGKVTYIAGVADGAFHKFIVAQCTEAVILGMLCTVGMLILRLPYATMIGAVICVTALIPVVGGLIGGAVGAFLILMESPMKALVFLIFLVLLQRIEGDLIYPRVVGSSIGLPAMWVLAAITIGGGVFGALGMLVGVPLASTVYKLIKNDLNKEEPLQQQTAET